jgi:hypothetical protein
MGYIKSFKSFQNAEKKLTTMGANPQLIEEDDSALLTDPELTKIRETKRNLEKQLEQIKQQEDTKLKELTTKAQAAKSAEQAAQNAAVNQQSAQAAQTQPTV